MKLNNKLLTQMRNVSRMLMGEGPAAATNAIQRALHEKAEQAASAPSAPPPMRDINPPPAPPSAPPSAAQRTSAAEPKPDVPPAAPLHDAADVLGSLMPDLMATLERANEAGRAAFKMPHFEVPDFNLPGMATPGDTLPGTFTDGSFTNPAGTRSYKLYVPSTITGAPAPLLVMLHGCTQDPVDFATGTQMNQLAEEMQCLVVYPAQSAQANPQRCWNWFNAIDQQRDQGEPSLIAGITRSIMEEHAVDPDQVYVAGLSAGGAMATIMGTLYPDLYAAVGVHSGLPFASAHDLPSAMAAMQGNFGRRPAPDSTVPIIVFHGDRDTTVHPANGDELVKRGARHASSDEIVIEPGKVPDGHAYTRTVHHRADGTPQAEQWLIHGAGHAWSGGSNRGSYTDGKGPDASREMMRFFRTKR